MTSAAALAKLLRDLQMQASNTAAGQQRSLVDMMNQQQSGGALAPMGPLAPAPDRGAPVTPTPMPVRGPDTSGAPDGEWAIRRDEVNNIAGSPRQGQEYAEVENQDGLVKHIYGEGRNRRVVAFRREAPSKLTAPGAHVLDMLHRRGRAGGRRSGTFDSRG